MTENHPERSSSYAEAIVQTIRHPLLVLDGELRVRSANVAFYETFRVSEESTAGQLVYELGNGQWNIDRLRELLEGILPEEQEITDFEVEHEFQQIGRRVMLLNGRAMLREDRPDLILLAIEDITERKQRETELIAQKEFSDKVVDAVREPLLIMNWDLQVQAANESFYKRFEVRREETEGRFIYEFGNGQWDIPRLRELLEKVLPENNTFDDYEVEHEFPDLGRRIMLLNARRIDHAKLILLAIEDVTEQRAAERRKQFLIDVNDAIGELEEPRAILELVTRSVAEHLGVSRVSYGEIDETEQIVRVLYRFRDGEGDEGQSCSITQFSPEMVSALRSGRTLLVSDVHQDRRTRQRTEVFDAVDATALLCAPILHEGRLYGFLALAHRDRRRWSEEDVTLAEQIALRTWSAIERIRAHYRLAALNETLEQRVRERTLVAERRAEQLRALAAELTRTEQRERRHLAAILHDHLQQQLIAAKMHASVVREDLSGESPRQLLQQVLDLLDESISTARSLSVELSPPVLHERGLAAGLEWLAGQMQKQHGLTIDVETEPGADPPSEETRELLFHSVRELLLNVKKHAGTNEAQVRMSREADHVRLEVIDRGAGFDTSGLEASTTFGLFHIRERLAPIGGRIAIASSPGRGTHTTITIPRDPEPVSGPLEPETAPQSDRIRILLVDDHRIIREGLLVLLEREPDLEVIAEAGDGQTAIEIARDLEPDVVLMDVSMPTMDGIEATHQIHTKMPHVRVIGLSLHGEDAMREAMINAGAVAYLTKGGPSHELIEAIREVAPPTVR